MKRIWISFLRVFHRELRIVVKDKDILTIILISPLFYAFFYGSVYIHKTENNIPLAVVDRSQSALSREFTHALDTHQMIEVKFICTEQADAVRELEAGRVQGILRIHAEFRDEIVKGRSAHLQVWLNTSRFLPANDLNKAITETAATYSAGIRIRRMQASGVPAQQALERYEPLKPVMKSLFNPAEAYGDFLIPGLLVLILHQTLLIGIAESIAREREFSVFRSWHRLAEGNTFVMLAGKSALYILIYAAYALIFFTLQFTLFKIPVNGSVSALIVLTVLMLIAVVLSGLYFASFFKRKILALQIFIFTSYPVFLLSGFSWPLEAMPLPLQWLSALLPATPYLQAFQRITLMGAGWEHIRTPLLHLACFIPAGAVLLRWRFHALARQADSGIPVQT